MSDGGGHRGNGNGHEDALPYHLIGASAEEVHRDARDVISHIDALGARLDQHADTLLNMGGDMAAVRREMTIVRADVHRCVDSVSAQQLLLEGIERKLAAILTAVKK